MVEFQLSRNIFRIADQEENKMIADNATDWFDENIEIGTSYGDKGSIIVIDFHFSVSAIITYTVDGGNTFAEFNNGDAVVGGQSRYIRVKNGDQVNFRSSVGGTLEYAIVGEP